MKQQNIFTFDKDLCFIDIETTGPVIGFHEIIDIAFIRTSPNAERRLSQCSFRIAPRHPERVTEFAQRLTGFATAEWANAHTLTKVWDQLELVAREGTPVCHNPSFDRAFVQLAALQNDLPPLSLDYHWIGTESLAWPLVKCSGDWPRKSFSQSSICRILGVKEEPALHSALEGAESCLRLYRCLPANHAHTCSLNRHWTLPATFLDWARRGFREADEHGLANAIAPSK